jgi:hypothetical protein
MNERIKFGPNEVVLVRIVGSFMTSLFFCLLQQHNTNFFDLSAGCDGWEEV